jgi:hypothetical protein
MTARPEEPKRGPRPVAVLLPESGDQAAALPPVIGNRLAFPGAPPTAPSFEQEVHTDLSYEKGLAVKALVAIALVLLVIAVRVYFLG